MADRYFVSRAIDGPSARLAGAEAHHLIHVLRATVGGEATLFDGSGAEFTARIRSIARAEVELEIISRTEVDRELGARLVLGAALPKGERARWLVEKATELGVARMVPLVCERSNERAGAHDKLRRAVVEASKQCGRNRLMEIAESRDLGDYLGDSAKADVRFMAHPGGADLCATLDALAARNQPLAEIALAIGPEGGFTQAEIEMAGTRHWQTIDLGPRVLRVETAALVLASLVAERLAKPRS